MSTPQASPVVHELTIPAGADIVLQGLLQIPPRARGLVLFVHGSGSSRFSPRNRFVADHLVSYGLATLLMDMLTPAEEALDQVTRALRFDIELLANRVVATIDWLRSADAMQRFSIGLFGASTGAAAALIAAARRPDAVRAVVSRGGRPDLAMRNLPSVTSPTLLIVGAEDSQTLELNRQALLELRSCKELLIIPHATHLFEETGTLEQVARHAGAWFRSHLIIQSETDAVVGLPG